MDELYTRSMPARRAGFGCSGPRTFGFCLPVCGMAAWASNQPANIQSQDLTTQNVPKIFYNHISS
jgi:hypothetical protein